MADDAAKKVEVTTGLTSSGVTEVTSGLQEGDQLVVVGQAYLEDGAPGPDRGRGGLTADEYGKV